MNKAWWIGAFIVVGVLLGLGILLLVTRPPRGQPVTLLPAPTPAPIIVYISGSVKQEGIYTLQYGSRVNDAIQAAGGFRDGADTGAINLARLLQDGEQLDVPAILPTLVGGTSSDSALGSNPLVDINTAQLESLDSLPGIGPATAQKIIDYRLVNGAFKTTEELLEVDGIGQATYDKIKDLVTVGKSP